MVVPARIRGRWGRREITRSLRTGNLGEARRRMLLWEAHVGAFLQHVDRKLLSMTRDEIEGLYRQYLDARFDEIEDRLSRPLSEEANEATSFVLNDEAHRISGALAHGEIAEKLPSAREMAREAGPEAHRKLARRLLEADLQATVAELNALEGRPLERPAPPQASIVRAAAAEAAEEQTSPLLSEVVSMYCDERIGRRKWSARTADQNQKIYGLMVNLLGDRPIHTVTKADIRTLGAEMLDLPANMTKRFPTLTPREILVAAKSHPDLPRLAPRSINKNYQAVRSLFLWAVEHDYITANPGTILRDVEEGRGQDARKDLDDQDIIAFLRHVDLKSNDAYARWIPKIMAFTGCRMGEAAQLEKRDVREVDGIWVFDINADHPEKRVKTGNSVRLIPIHPRLVELGFLDFVLGCGEGFIFPRRIRFSDNPKRSAVGLLSQRLNRWLRDAGIGDDRKQVQSFRETVATRLKDLGTPEYQIAEILGHENDNITTGRYGKRTNLGTLHQALSRLQLPI